jgi:hypothetical protein
MFCILTFQWKVAMALHNNALQLTASSVRSYLAPASSSS